MSVPPRKQKTNGRVGPLEHAEKKARRGAVDSYASVVGTEAGLVEESIAALGELPKLPGAITEYLEATPVDIVTRARIGVVVTTAAHEDMNLRMMLAGWTPLVPKGATNGSIDRQLVKTQLYARRSAHNPRHLVLVPIVFPYIDSDVVLDPIGKLAWLEALFKNPDKETYRIATAWRCHLDLLVNNYISSGAKGGGIFTCEDPSDYALARTLPKSLDEVVAYAMNVY